MVISTPTQRDSLRKKKAYAELKNRALDAYGRRCVCCGESRYQFLTFQHSHGDGAQHRAEICGNYRYGGASFVRALNRRNFPPVAGLVVMCYNCHYATDMNGMCPHQLERLAHEHEGER
jgi:hypothetical protein